MKVPTARAIPQFYNGHWDFHRQMGKPEYVGFIYVIHDKFMGKFYLGKKNYRTSSGQEMDWRKYLSSSKHLQGHLAVRPREEFDFICLEEYKTRSGLAYAETWTLCFVNAPLSDKWYNKSIEQISWKVKEPVSVDHLARLHKVTG